MKECQFQALLTLQSREDALADELVERVHCTCCDRHVEFRTSNEFPLVFPKMHERVLLTELCKNCGGGDNAQTD